MTLQVGDHLITSPDTPHKAARMSITRWGVTWLRRDHVLTRSEATTAMMIASIVGQADNHELGAADPMRGHVGNWAAELGLDVAEAIKYAARPPRWEV